MTALGQVSNSREITRLREAPMFNQNERSDRLSMAQLISRRRRLATAAALTFAGFIAIIAGWFGVSGTRVISDQLSYLASGVALGLALIGCGGGVLIADYQSEQRRQMDRLTDLVEALLVGGAVPGPAATANGDRVGGAALVALDGSSRVHRADCVMVRGKPQVNVLSAAEAADAGLTPCRACSPALEV